VPKRDLIVGLQVLLQRGGLQIAAGLQFGRKLVEEMMAMEVRVSPAGNEQYAAWREGTHDDPAATDFPVGTATELLPDRYRKAPRPRHLGRSTPCSATPILG
jgi:hypothetical protein